MVNWKIKNLNFWQSYFLYLPVLLFTMSGYRFISLVFAKLFFQSEKLNVFMDAFNMGFRFDLLILGFLSIPVLIFWYTSSFAKLDRMVFKFCIIIYLSTVVILINSISFFDIPYFTMAGTHLHLGHWQNFDIMDFSFLSNFQLIFLVIFYLLNLTMGIVGVINILSFNKIYLYDFAGKQKVLYAIIPFFLIGFFARGTVTAHHLNIKHCQISLNKSVEQLCLNPHWTLDKKR